MKQKIFFIGIGGKGLNGIAKICHEMGYIVEGVDTAKKKEIDDLEKFGIKIYDKHSFNNVNENIDTVIYTSIAKNVPEITEAKRLGIKVMKRSQFLKDITRNGFNISIAGSHGKSTTTALLGLSMINQGIDATIFGGAYTKEFDGYNHYGKSKFNILEACEYDRSFHDLIGDVTIITSIEKSHLEYYENEKEMLESFEEFISRHKEDSVILTNGDDVKTSCIAGKTKGKVIYYGFGIHNDYVINKVNMEKDGSTFSVCYKGKEIISNIKINIPGKYNILNFASIISTLHDLNIPLGGVEETSRIFTGVGRRFEVHENKQGQILIDDFAHHPTQVKYLFDGIRQYYPDNKVCAVFQPRQYNIMKNFINEYGEAFDKADEIILTDILPALGDTEDDIRSINIEEVSKSIQDRSKKPVRIIKTFPEITKYIQSRYGNGDVITTIGAGNIYEVRDMLK